MEKITIEGIEINFNDLSEQKQSELYYKNKNKYKQDAIKSIYSSIRKKVVIGEHDSKLLNEMLRNEINKWQNEDVEKAIFYNFHFKPEEETIKKLAVSKYWKHRKKAAELSKDPELLNEILRNEISIINKSKYWVAADVEEAIFHNFHFKPEEETIKQLAASKQERHRKKAAELSKDSKFLN